MLHPGDVIAIRVLIEGRIAQHERAMCLYRGSELAAILSSDQVAQAVAHEREGLEYYSGLLERFQRAAKV